MLGSPIPRLKRKDHRPRVHPSFGRGQRSPPSARQRGEGRIPRPGHPVPRRRPESGGGSGTANVKDHHNVGGLPDDLEFSLVEPLRLLFKDEVRAVGRELGLPEEIVARQPFPGPGLAIRIVGEVTADRPPDLLRRADAIREELTAAGL